MPLVKVFEPLGLELVVVFPHPLYPLWSSAISEVIPTAGSVGSLLGLKPYSSTSFLRASSAVFFCLRLLHNKIPPTTRSATTTTGTTTAMAVLPPVPRPPCSCLFAGLCKDAGDDELDAGLFDAAGPLELEGKV